MAFGKIRDCASPTTQNSDRFNNHQTRGEMYGDIRKYAAGYSHLHTHPNEDEQNGESAKRKQSDGRSDDGMQFAY